MKNYKWLCTASLALLALTVSQGVEAAEAEEATTTDALVAEVEASIEVEGQTYVDGGKIDHRVQQGERYGAQAEVVNHGNVDADVRFGVAHLANPDHLIWEASATAPAGQASTVEALGVADDSSNDTHLVFFNDADHSLDLKADSLKIHHVPFTEEEIKAMEEALYAQLPQPSQDFRVLPYLQSPSSTSMAINWVSEFDTPGTVHVREAGSETSFSVPATPVYMERSEYTPAEIQQTISFNNGNGQDQSIEQGSWLHSNTNYKSEVDLVNLKPDTTYHYKVEQGDSVAEGSFTTFPSADDWDHIRLIAFSDTETEPKGRIENREWELHTTQPYAPGSEERPAIGSAYHQVHGHAKRNGQDLVRYPLTQFTALNENIAWIEEAKPHALIIAGDLTQGAGYQPAWDEFWLHFAGEESDLASHIPLITALGNWETYAAINGGYANAALSRHKYHDYMDTPGDPNHRQYKDSYYRTDIGPVTILTLDSTKGIPTEIVGQVLTGETYSGNDSILKEEIWATQGLEGDPYLTTDTQGSFTWEQYEEMFEHLHADKTKDELDLPGFNPGTAQWVWAKEQLADARQQAQIILVQFHHAPYSSGVHGMAPNFEIPDNQSGVAMRVYTPLFEKYGVAAVIAGHDEMFERSFVDKDGDGIGFHVYDVGVAADGLRSEKMIQDEAGQYYPLNYNTHSQWSATAHAPEMWATNDQGVKHLIDGGLHYGHLQMDLVKTPYGAQMMLEPVYIFPVLNDDYSLSHTERRVYDDVTTIYFNSHGQVISQAQAVQLAALVELENRVNALDGLVDGLQAKVQSQQLAIGQVQAEAGQAHHQLDQLDAQINHLNDQVAALEQELAECQACQAASLQALAPLSGEETRQTISTDSQAPVIQVVSQPTSTEETSASASADKGASSGEDETADPASSSQDLPQTGLDSAGLLLALPSLLAGLGLSLKRK